jgi:arylsulfatase A-like enzyme
MIARIGIHGFMALAAVVSLCPRLTTVNAAAAPAPKPNILFIFADDWGWGDLSCHGNLDYRTPNLDRLASEGTDFRQFEVLSPVCSASRVGVMTGRFPARYGIHEHFGSPAMNRSFGQPDWLDPQAPTIAKFLKSAGYHTGHFGKWHLSPEVVGVDAPSPAEYGFDEFAIFDSGQHPWPHSDYFKIFDQTIAFIKANHNRPFYINLWIHQTHVPFAPSQAAMEANRNLDKRKQIYAAAVTDGDNGVGRVLAALKELNLDANTLVIFASDNGPALVDARDNPLQPGHYGGYYNLGTTGGLRGRKRSVFEGGVRLPFIVRWPGHVPAGKKDETSVISAGDLLPTFCAAAGMKLPADYPGAGENMLPVLEGKAAPRTKPLFWLWRETKDTPDFWGNLAVRDGNWKMVMTFDQHHLELHDLGSDRPETNNVAAQHSELVARLSKMALDWYATLPLTTQVNPAFCSKERQESSANTNPGK